jgi:hypothetical protein
LVLSAADIATTLASAGPSPAAEYTASAATRSSLGCSGFQGFRVYG